MSPHDSNSSRRDARTQLLETAIAVLHRVGARAFTMDAVAREAGVSKGGLIHHFPNREALIEGMFELVHARFEDRFEKALQEEPEGSGRRTRAYIRSNFQVVEEGHRPYVLSLVELMAVEPDLLVKSFKDKDCDFHQMIEDDGLDPAYATVLTSSSDAFWLGHVLGFVPMDSERTLQMQEQLIAMTRPPFAKYKPEGN